MVKKTAKRVVAENLEAIRAMGVADLTQFGKASGFDSRPGFAAWKRALAAAGVDYESLHAERRVEKQAAREAAVTHSLTLYTDARARTCRFAVCDTDGAPVWHGRFFEDRNFNGEQSSGELASALKAVWLASKVAQAVKGVIRLTLLVDAEWLLWANASGRTGGKAGALRREAERLGVILQVEHVAGRANPADKFTVCHGFQRYQDYGPGLANLVDGGSRAMPEPKPIIEAPVAKAEGKA